MMTTHICNRSSPVECSAQSKEILLLWWYSSKTAVLPRHSIKHKKNRRTLCFLGVSLPSWCADESWKSLQNSNCREAQGGWPKSHLDQPCHTSGSRARGNSTLCPGLIANAISSHFITYVLDKDSKAELAKLVSAFMLQAIEGLCSIAELAESPQHDVARN